MLIPVVSIPEREMIIWRHPEIAQTVLEGLAEAEAGQTVERPGFTEIPEDEPQDED